MGLDAAGCLPARSEQLHSDLSGTYIKAFAKKKNSKKSEITMEVGGWVQVSLGWFFF